MKGKFLNYYLLVFTFLAACAFSNWASAAVDNNASVVHVRTSCDENGATIANCFETTTAVLSWIGATKKPNASAPLLVDIGPGKFDELMLSCGGTISNITFRGAGMGKTIIGKPNELGVQMNACENMSFNDMTVKSAFIAVYWQGDGSSVWTNVEVDGGTYGWSETLCGSITKPPVHYWFNSRIHAKGKTAYLAACSQNWIFGSEVVNEGNLSGISSTIMARAANGDTTSRPEIHLYGSVLRNIMGSGTSYTPIAATVGTNAQIHIHGTGIDVIGNELPNNIVALSASPGGTIHATQSAFVMQTAPGGKAIRIQDNGGVIKAPYLWEKEILDSASPLNLQSEDGADSVMELVCSDASCTKKYPHLMVYTTECGANPWFDTVTGACR